MSAARMWETFDFDEVFDSCFGCRDDLILLSYPDSVDSNETKKKQFLDW